MELPDLGKHCSDKSCKQLDFLPVKCDACRQIYCTDHFPYASHSCPDAYKKDNQVPMCPLCNKPIPVPPRQTPDQAVSGHIDTDCQSDPAKEKRGKIYSNRCSKKGCKTKELVPFKCEGCRENFCIKHRHETDHSCRGFQGSGKSISSAGAAAVARQQVPNNQVTKTAPRATPPQRTNVLNNIGSDLNRERVERQRALQGGMSEDEALAAAMAMSLSDAPSGSAPSGSAPSGSAPSGSGSPSSPSSSSRQEQEEADAALARALQQSEEESRRGRRPQQQQSSDKSSCSLS